MAVELPAPIAGYFMADLDADADAVASQFSEDATVSDEGMTYTGREAIRDWKIASSRKYTYVAEPYAVADEAGLTVVTANVSGDFPGSPIDLRYRFALDGDRIARLEIVA